MSHKEKKEGITQLNSNAKLLNILRRIVIIDSHKNFMLLLKGLQNGDKTIENIGPTVKPQNQKFEGDRKPLDLKLENQLV